MNTPRRRFFPSTRTQQLPARSVELQVQLHPHPLSPIERPALATGAPADAPPWLSWLAPLTWDWGPYNDDYKTERQPDGRLRIEDPWNGLDYSLWDGEPALELYGAPTAVPGAAFCCTALQVTCSGRRSYGGKLFSGVALGPAPGTIEWTISWDHPAADLSPGLSLLGHHASGFGNVLLVRVKDTGGGGDAIDTLTATASTPTGELGQLILGLRSVAY